MTAATVVDVATVALDRAPEGEAEALVIANNEQLTRFASNRIHQNVAERSLRLHARVVSADRMGVAEAAGSDPEQLAETVMGAAENARRVSPATEVPPLPEPDGGLDGPVAFNAATAATTPEQRADMVGEIVSRAAEHGLRAYGFVSTASRETAIANTRGVRRRAVSTQASSVVVVMGDAGSGYASRHAADIGRLDVAAMASVARLVAFSLADLAAASRSFEASTPACATRTPNRSSPERTRSSCRRMRWWTCSSTSAGWA